MAEPSSSAGAAGFLGEVGAAGAARAFAGAGAGAGEAAVERLAPRPVPGATVEGAAAHGAAGSVVGADEVEAGLTDEPDAAAAAALADERDAAAAGGAEVLNGDSEQPSHELEHDAPRLPPIRSRERGSGGGGTRGPREGGTGCGCEAGIGGRGRGRFGGEALTNAASIDAKSVAPAFRASTTACSRAPCGCHSARGTTSGSRCARFLPPGGWRDGGVSSRSPAGTGRSRAT